MKVLYRSKSLQDVVNPTYSGLSPTKLLQIRLKVPHEKHGYIFLKEQKCKVTTNVTLRCGDNAVSSRQVKVMPPVCEGYLQRSRTKIGEATTFCTASPAGKTRTQAHEHMQGN